MARSARSRYANQNVSRRTRKKSIPGVGAQAGAHSRWGDALGLTLLTAAVFTGTCLASFAVQGQPGANLVGPVGDLVAGWMLRWFGVSAFAVALAFGLASLFSFRALAAPIKVLEVLGYAALTVLGATLVHLALDAAPVFGYGPGGLTGRYLAEALSAQLSRFGAIAAVSGLLGLALMATLEIPLGAAVRLGVRALQWCLSAVFGLGAEAAAVVRARAALAWEARGKRAALAKMAREARRAEQLQAARAQLEAEWEVKRAMVAAGQIPGDDAPVVEVRPTEPRPPRVQDHAAAAAGVHTPPAAAAAGDAADAGSAVVVSDPGAPPDKGKKRRKSSAVIEIDFAQGTSDAAPVATPAIAVEAPAAGTEPGIGAPVMAADPVPGPAPAAAAEPVVTVARKGPPPPPVNPESLPTGEDIVAALLASEPVLAPAAPAAVPPTPVGSTPKNPAEAEIAASAPGAADGGGPVIVDLEKERARKRATETEDKGGAQQSLPIRGLDPDRAFELPSIYLLDPVPEDANVRQLNEAALTLNAKLLEEKLADYSVPGKVMEIRPGPVVTMYEFKPNPGIKISKIAGLADDLAMNLSALSVRIVAPIPGKDRVGIEVPNSERATVFIRELLESKPYRGHASPLRLAIGKDIEGDPLVVDMAKMPHLLVAGATGTGKSVAINAFIMSILYAATPRDVRMIMVDPKMVELSIYNDIPHLLLPVVTDPKQAALALMWAVEEMERRYQLLADAGVRDITRYNRYVRRQLAEGGPWDEPDAGESGIKPPEELPFVVVVVDELADLMMVAPKDIETSIARLAQKARAAGMHLLLATQRPSTDVITGVIKANFPTRLSFKVSSGYDSKTILDAPGAERLLGMGDMLLLPPGASELRRAHGALVTEEEIHRVVEFLKAQGKPVYNDDILRPRETGDAEPEEADDGDRDEMYDKAVAIVAETRMASISMLQRRLRVGYNRAARMVEWMEKDGIVGPPNHQNVREVLVPPVAA